MKHKPRLYKLPEVLTQLLKDNKMTRKKLSQMMGMSDTVAGKWANGESIPKLFEVMLIADIFNVSIEYLVYGAEGSDE